MKFLIDTGLAAIIVVLAIAGLIWAGTRSPAVAQRARAIIGGLPVPARTSTGQARGRAARRGRHRAGAAR